MIYFPEGMELEEVSVVFQGSVNDVVVCRDRRSAAGTLYTLLAIHDRECARKMLEVMENGQKGESPPACSSLPRTRLLCLPSPTGRSGGSPPLPGDS